MVEWRLVIKPSSSFDKLGRKRVKRFLFSTFRQLENVKQNGFAINERQIELLSSTG